MTHPELCTVIMSCSRIEIDQNIPFLKFYEKSIETEFLQHHNTVIMVKLPSVLSFDRCSDIETVQHFCTRLVRQIIETPIRLWIQFFQSCIPLHLHKPLLIPTGDFRMIERYQNFTFVSVYFHFKPTIATSISMYCLTKTHLTFRISFACLFVHPTIVCQ